MKRSITLTTVTVWMLTFFVLNNVWAFEAITREVTEEKIVEEVKNVKTADNLIIIFDGSSSTNEKADGTDLSRIKASKKWLKSLNQWMPEDLELNCGVYITSGWSALKTIQEIKPSNQASLEKVVEGLPEKGKGNDLLLQSMAKLEKIIEPLSGKTSVIWFTDNIINEIDEFQTPAGIATRIHEKNDVRFYVINTCDKDQDDLELAKVTAINGASQVVSIKHLLNEPDYLAKAVYESKVESHVKKIPRTEVVGFVTDDMLFDTDSDVIRPEYTQELDKLAEFLNGNPKASLVIQGHTDSSGSQKYNLSLSAKRANQVKQYLIKNYSLEPERMVALWYGDQKPAADNTSKKGRQLNRRVELAVKGL